MLLSIIDRKHGTIRRLSPSEFANDATTKTVTFKAWTHGISETIRYDVIEPIKNWEEVTVYV